ncbi:MAG TPA: 30S ribosomal protein S6 [Desulfobacterales bacterium]|nr:30S ribosomal protein S6 [Desulfobacterales bacterium]
MNRYETFIISDPDISDEKRASLFERINQLIPKENGFMVAFDEWGIKKLAYEIKKKIRGHYVRLDYCGTGTLVNEIERFSRIDDRVMKYMTVLLEKEADIDRIKEEIAKAEQVAALVEESETGPGPAEESETDPAEKPETDPTEKSETDPVEEPEKNQDDKSDSDPVLFDAPGSEAMETEKVKTEKKDEEE